MNTGILKKIYLAFKRGKNEGTFFISLYTFLIVSGTTAMKTLTYGLGVIVIFIIVGWYLIYFVDTTQNRMNPFSQDNLKAGYYHRLGLIMLTKGEYQLAEKYFIQSNEIMVNWIEEINN